MVIVDNSAVRADRNIDTGLFVIGVSSSCHLDQRSCLASSDSLLFSCDADRASADSDFDEISSGLRQETESFRIHHIACAHLHTLSVILPDIVDGDLLPLGKALRAVDAEHIGACFQKCWNTFLIVSRIDTRSHHVALGTVNQLVFIFLMAVVILAEHEIDKLSFFINQRKTIDLVFPDNVVGFL